MVRAVPHGGTRSEEGGRIDGRPGGRAESRHRSPSGGRLTLWRARHSEFRGVPRREARRAASRGCVAGANGTMARAGWRLKASAADVWPIGEQVAAAHDLDGVLRAAHEGDEVEGGVQCSTQ